ncbi:oligosaccharide flippase family protein, partial [Enterococcus faecium]|nr:oligosaccharide flippase family protein [Enterococcus faecium]
MKKTIKSSKILGPLFQLTAGSAIAQLITIMVSPLTTRLFTSEDLGIYTLILTIISIFGPVLNGKFDMSIVKSKDHDELVDYLNLSLIIGFLFSIFVSVGYTVYLFNNKVIMGKVGLIIFVILPIILMASALINTLTSLNNFEKNYYLISKVYVVRNISQNIMMISAGLIHLGVIGLILSQLASLFFGIKSQAISLKKELIFMKQRFSILNIKKSFLKEKNQL